MPSLPTRRHGGGVRSLELDTIFWVLGRHRNSCHAYVDIAPDGAMLPPTTVAPHSGVRKTRTNFWGVAKDSAGQRSICRGREETGHICHCRYSVHAIARWRAEIYLLVYVGPVGRPVYLRLIGTWDDGNGRRVGEGVSR